MAFTVTDLANGTSITSGTTLSTGGTVTGTVANHDWFVVIVGCNTSEAISSVTDSVGNTYTQRALGTYSPGAVVEVAIYTAPVTTDITNGTITVTWASNHIARTIQVYRVRPGASQTVNFSTSGTSAGATSTSTSIGPISVANTDVIFCGTSILNSATITGDSDTTNGSWSTLVTRLADTASGTDDQLGAQYKITTGSGNQTWTATFSNSHTISAYVALTLTAQSIVAGAGSYSLTGTAATPIHTQKITAGAGSYALTGTAATLKEARKVTAGDGSYALTGTAVTLTKLFGSKTLSLGAGSYAITGTAATPKHGWKVIAEVGSFSLTGTAASLKWADPGGSSDGRARIPHVGDGYAYDKAARDKLWRQKQKAKRNLRGFLDATWDGKEYVEPIDLEEMSDAERTAYFLKQREQALAIYQAQQAAAAEQERQRQLGVQMGQQMLKQQAADDEDAAASILMGD